MILAGRQSSHRWRRQRLSIRSDAYPRDLQHRQAAHFGGFLLQLCQCLRASRFGRQHRRHPGRRHIDGQLPGHARIKAAHLCQTGFVLNQPHFTGGRHSTLGTGIRGVGNHGHGEQSLFGGLTVDLARGTAVGNVGIEAHLRTIGAGWLCTFGLGRCLRHLILYLLERDQGVGALVVIDESNHLRVEVDDLG